MTVSSGRGFGRRHVCLPRSADGADACHPGLRPAPAPVNECVLHRLTARAAPALSGRGGPVRRHRRRPEWFGACRRAWDLGAVARRSLGPVAAAGARAASNGRSATRWRSTTSPGCGAGTARSSSRSCFAAYDRAARPAASVAPAGRRTSCGWAAERRPVHAAAGRGRRSTCTCPIRSSPTPTWPRRTVRPSATATASPWCWSTTTTATGSATTASSRSSRPTTSCCSTSAASSRAGRGTRSSWRRTIAGIQYTEIRASIRPAFRRTRRAARIGASRRTAPRAALGRAGAGDARPPTLGSSRRRRVVALRAVPVPCARASR